MKKTFGKTGFFKKTTTRMARHPLLSSFLSLFLALILGGFLFYYYAISAQNVSFNNNPADSLLKEDIYNAVFKVWQTQEENFKAADSKEYLNPFKKVVEPIPSPTKTPIPTRTPSSPTPVSSPSE